MGMIFHKMFACMICLSASSRVCIHVFILNSIRHFLTSKPFFNFIRIWIIVVRRHLIGSLSPNRELSHSLMDAITTFVSRCASTLKFDFLWDKTAKTTSSNVRVTIVYFVIYRESYTFIFFFQNWDLFIHLKIKIHNAAILMCVSVQKLCQTTKLSFYLMI